LPRLCSHSSRRRIAPPLQQPTRATSRNRPAGSPKSTTFWGGPIAAPIRSCSRWGLPCRHPLPGPRWALTPPFQFRRTEVLATCFLLHCPWGRPRRALPGTVIPWSPDFPRPACASRGCPAL